MHYHHHLRFSRSFFILTSLLCVLICAPAFSQSALKIYGQVFNDDGPVPNLIIRVNNSSYEVLTDQRGNYRIYDIPPGNYQLSCYLGADLISSTGMIVLKDGPAIRQDIYLGKDIVNLREEYIEAAAPRSILGSSNKVAVYQLDHSDVKSIEQVIEQIPGLNLVRSTAGGEVYISAGGMRPEGVNVLIDGRKINSLLTGRANINQLPFKAITKVEYYQSGGAQSSTDGGIGGTVNFVTESKVIPDKFDIDIIRGSYNNETYSAALGFHRNHTGKIYVIGESGFARNDFDYTFFDDTLTRENAFNHHNKYYLAYSNSIYGNQIEFSGYHYRNKNGVPGRINDPTSEAASEKNTSSFRLNSSRMLGSSLRLGLSSSYQERKTLYADSGSWIPFKNSYYEKEYDIKLEVEKPFNNSLTAYESVSFASGLLNGIDHIRPDDSLGKWKRDIFKLLSSLNFNKRVGRFDINSGLSYAFTNVQSDDYSSGSISLSLIYKWRFDLGINSSFSRAFRLPGLAELHWKEDVFVMSNPDLRPEKSKSISTEIFSEFEFLGKWRISTDYTDTRYTDLIYWQRSVGLKFKPENISKSDFYNTTSIISYRSPGKFIELNFSREHSVALNREDDPLVYGKFITFQPSYSNRLHVKLNYRQIHLKAEMLDVGERYYIDVNTKALRPYTLVNLGLGFNINYKIVKTSWLFEINNITDIKYEHLKDQPNKPRFYSLSFNLKI